MSTETITELQQARDALRQNILDVDETIKKLTGRDPSDTSRNSLGRRVQLKRHSYGGDRTSNHQPPAKISNLERRRWGTGSFNRGKRLDSGGEEQEETKPAVHSSVVVTGGVEAIQPLKEDKETKTRNRRMFGLLVGTLKKFKKDSQVKSEQEHMQEQKLHKIEEQVQKEKEVALVERKELYQSRRTKQRELQQLEFKLEMAELTVELRGHYANINEYIQLKSTPRVFYKPAEHNKQTSNLLTDSRKNMQDCLEQRLKEIEMFGEMEVISKPRSIIKKDMAVVVEAKPTGRDLFAEDADNETREDDTEKMSEHEVMEEEKPDEKNEEEENIAEVVADESDKVATTFDVVDERIVELNNDI